MNMGYERSARNTDTDMRAAPTDIILPGMEKPIDEIIAAAYHDSDLATQMLAALQDPDIRRWPKALRKTLRVPMTDCKVASGRIYYRDRLFAPPDIDELKTQILYRTHSSGLQAIRAVSRL